MHAEDGVPVTPPGRRLDPPELLEVARRVGRAEDVWRERLERCADDRTYVSLFLDEHVGVWAISWSEDTHDTGYHDHDRSCGAVYVADGVIRHEKLRLGHRPVGEPVAAGDGFCFDNSVIHRMRKEPGAPPTVTVHAYSPPLTFTGQYGDPGDGLLHRVPTGSEEHLSPKGGQGTDSTD
ncbi:cysteine dioxygenase [Streptomyces minutiscleroticus]|uniref:Cysteine dioxygenase n=1 Tax=Streptomyces minutiscleroticus TaxID=68238 RepID=A0A918U371_9ACTN|nr:cysteine dioxygenase [Streptomyces minutiscleroticus]GGX84991.1 cysteine dioxygenase [Streptomyces minutiscleroticus]